MKDLTLKEIQIIFGLLYDLTAFTKYVSGYRKGGQLYDVLEEDDTISVYYSESHWLSLPVTKIEGIYK